MINSFTKYIAYRENSLEQDAAKVGLAHVGDKEASLSSLFRLSRVIWEKYPEEMRSFFMKLSERDPEISEEFRRLEAGNDRKLPPNDKDEISPTSVDSGGGGEEGEGGELGLMFRTFLEKNGISYDYSSLQFKYPATLASKIIAWGKQHIEEKDVFKEGSRYGRENEVHTTVLYGIHSASPEETRELLENQKPFSVKLGEVSLFSNERYDVVKISVESTELVALNRKLRSNLEYTSSFKLYKPHITISYTKKGSVADLAGNRDFLGTEVMIERLQFSSKNGQKSDITLVG